MQSLSPQNPGNGTVGTYDCDNKAMHAQLKTLALAQDNQARPKRKFYCWGFSINFTHGIKTCSENKAVNQEEVYYKKRIGGSEKGCE